MANARAGGFDQRAQVLRGVGVFADLGDNEIAELAAMFETRDLAPGTVLIQEGDEGAGFFVVAQGRLRITHSGPGGREVHLGDALPNECVGEMALLRDVRRDATVLAVEHSTVLDLPSPRFKAFLEANPLIGASVEAQIAHRERWKTIRLHRPSAEEVVELLGRILVGTPRQLLESLEHEVQWVAVPRGTLLMREGEPADCAYFVASGHLRTFVTREDGNRMPLADIGPGESVGEMALLGMGPRSATVEALDDCELLRMSRAGFDELLDRHPTAGAVLARIMAGRLQQGLKARNLIAQLRTVPLVGAEECIEVVAHQHLVMRNLKVTEAYYRLSVGMALLVGHQNTNWLTYACNASKTAGSFIRGEGVPLSRVVQSVRRAPGISTLGEAAERLVRSFPASRAAEDRLAAAIAQVGHEVSAGNTKVFSELGTVFARFIAAYHDRSEYDRGEFESFLDGLELRPGPSEAGGQDALRRALGHYHEAMFQPEEKRKAELILLANLNVGLHEQIRLQPHIENAMNAPLSEGLFEVIHLGPLTDVLRENLMLAWRHFATRMMMRLRLPYYSLPLGDDLPLLRTRQVYPDTLARLEHPELRRFAERYGSPIDRRWFKSRDWSDLEQRMCFVFQLFRTRQKSLELFDPPFQYEQRLSIAGNRLPAGEL